MSQNHLAGGQAVMYACFILEYLTGWTLSLRSADAMIKQFRLETDPHKENSV